MSNPYDYFENWTVMPKHLCDPANCPEDAKYARRDDSLLPSKIIVNPTGDRYAADRQLQVTTNFSVTRTKKGRIFLNYFSCTGHADESYGNWCMAVISDDDGKTFRNSFVVEPPVEETTRTFELHTWIDPDGKLRIFWAQAHATIDGRAGVWTAVCDDPDADTLVFSEPKRICNGVVANEPIVTKNGEWLLSAYIPSGAWAHGSPKITDTYINWLPEEQGISIYSSKDKGESYTRIAGNIRFPYSVFDENYFVERKDGSLWMMIRGMNCTAQTTSTDGGHTWAPATLNMKMPLPNTHFCLGKLKGGNLLLICNYKADMFSFFGGRNHLTALISRDEGQTWEGFLSIDEREGSEQPSFFEADNGFIYIGYGRAPQYAAETCLCIVTEEDILAGKLVNPKSRMGIVAHKATGMCHTAYYPELCRIAKENNIEM